MILNFTTNPNIDYQNLHDSMQLDSGQTIAELKVENESAGIEITIETQGHVKVFYHPDPNCEADEPGGSCYRYPSDFPDELKALFASGKADEAKNVDTVENNWFELFVTDTVKKRMEYSEVFYAEKFTEEELFKALMETYNKWATEFKLPKL